MNALSSSESTTRTSFLAKNRLKNAGKNLFKFFLLTSFKKVNGFFVLFLTQIQILRHQIFLLIRVNIVTWLECRFSSGDTH
jgi:hypothetical protein